MTPLDPYLAAQTSLGNRLLRVGWEFAYQILFRFSPRPAHAWRALLLRCFGARLGPHCHVYAGAKIWAPWNRHCDDAVGIADGVVIYNPATVYLGSHAVISQDAYLCGATHDYNDPQFPMISTPIHIGQYAWICARATVCSGVSVGDGAVLALGGIATKDLAPWTVYAGIPAKAIKTRVLR